MTIKRGDLVRFKDSPGIPGDRRGLTGFVTQGEAVGGGFPSVWLPGVKNPVSAHPSWLTVLTVVPKEPEETETDTFTVTIVRPPDWEPPTAQHLQGYLQTYLQAHFGATPTITVEKTL